MTGADSNVGAVVVPGMREVGDSLDARGLALLVGYLKRTPDCTPDQELIARDAFLVGFRAGYRRGGRDALDSCTELATAMEDRSFRTALATLLQFVDERC